ncbi:hypothetical protein V6N13_140703 [Hibiscus sabdariffa]
MGVSSSSTINANYQFPKSGETKVPHYLGWISTLVCFLAAVVSLGIGIAIVPRQVMPWTGHQRHTSSCDVATWYYGLASSGWRFWL